MNHINRHYVILKDYSSKISVKYVANDLFCKRKLLSDVPNLVLAFLINYHGVSLNCPHS